jgi:hypothetical protein
MDSEYYGPVYHCKNPRLLGKLADTTMQLVIF